MSLRFLSGVSIPRPSEIFSADNVKSGGSDVPVEGGEANPEPVVNTIVRIILKNLGVAAALAAFPPTGIFGVDKYYVSWGEDNEVWKLGLIQTVLSVVIIGLIVSVPWMYLSTIVLIIGILWGGVWRPFTLQ